MGAVIIKQRNTDISRNPAENDDVELLVDADKFLAYHAKKCPSKGERLFPLKQAISMSFAEQLDACGFELSEEEKAMFTL
jgi:hypothetical protein